MEFEFENYKGKLGKKMFHCKITVNKTKCKCDFECYPWKDSDYFRKCNICDVNFCGNCSKECNNCELIFCNNHENKTKSIKCDECGDVVYLCSNCQHKSNLYESCCEYCI